MTRTFIALEMNTALQRHLAGVIHQMAQILPGIRWVDPASIHLTLAFLGELTDEQLAEAIHATAMASQQAQPFSYCLSHLGIFGSPRSPRVIWMGIEEPSGSLISAHRLLQQQLLQHGFAIDTRSFSPHLTLARLKSPLSLQEQQRLQSLLANQSRSSVSTDAYSAHHLHVMKSELQLTGTRYICLKTIQLQEQERQGSHLSDDPL
jgi:RNA 2',3'-cyclic 3'-phosphodiesterase